MSPSGAQRQDWLDGKSLCTTERTFRGSYIFHPPAGSVQTVPQWPSGSSLLPSSLTQSSLYRGSSGRLGKNGTCLVCGVLLSVLHELAGRFRISVVKVSADCDPGEEKDVRLHRHVQVPDWTAEPTFLHQFGSRKSVSLFNIDLGSPTA